MKKSQFVPNQRGAGFLTTIIFLVVFGFLASIGLKSLQVYIEFWSIESALKSIVQNPAYDDNDDIRRGFDKHVRIDNIESVKSSDLTINNGELSVTYQKVVPLVSNVSLLFDFNASSNH